MRADGSRQHLVGTGIQGILDLPGALRHWSIDDLRGRSHVPRRARPLPAPLAVPAAKLHPHVRDLRLRRRLREAYPDAHHTDRMVAVNAVEIFFHHHGTLGVRKC